MTNPIKSLRVKQRVFQAKNSRIYKSILLLIQKKPFHAFFISLGTILLVLIVGTLLANLSQKESPAPQIVKDVNVYQIGISPRIILQGSVKKSGVVNIFAQTPGIVQAIHTREGESVRKGSWIISLSTNYQGADAAGVQAQLARTQYQNVLDIYDSQKDLIKKQREIADKSKENTEKLSDISESARNDTESLLNFNQEILKQMQDSLSSQIASGATDADTLAAKQQITQAQTGVNQLRNAVNSLNYQINNDNPPEKLAELQKDLALKQLDLSEKALDVNKEISKLQTDLAYIAASLMHPSSPFSGIVEKIFVKIGDQVAPGTKIATITGNNNEITVSVLVPESIAKSAAKSELSTIHIKNTTYKSTMSYVSENATDGQLYTILFTLPEEFNDDVTDNESISIDIPIGQSDTLSLLPFIPLDAVYQTQDESYVYIVENKKAKSKKVEIGTVYGNFVTVDKGLSDKDLVITNRNVVSGEDIKIKN